MFASSNKIACPTVGLKLEAHCTEVQGSNGKGGSWSAACN